MSKVSALLLFLGACCWALLHGTGWGLPLPLSWGLDARWRAEEGGDEPVGGGASSIGCTLCLDFISLLQIVVDSNGTLDDIYPLAEKICVLILKEAAGRVICPGFIRSYGPPVMYVIARDALPPREICESLHYCENSSRRTSELPHGGASLQMLHEIRATLATILDGGERSGKGRLGWHRAGTQRLSAMKEPHSPGKVGRDRSLVGMKKAEEKERGGTRGKKVSVGSDTITILQLTDIHLDSMYEEGSPSQCGLYMCCRSWYNGTDPAGHYGAYKCDLPLVTLELLLDTLRGLDPQPDFVVYTGDNPPHDVWNETWSSQIGATQFVVDYLSEKLPNLVIYPAIGNHETWPQSEYLASLPEYQYLTKELAEYWQTWVPNLPSAALESIAEGAYYSVKIMDGLRILSFNSDYWYRLNVYTYLNGGNVHFQRMKNWIFAELTQAEKAGDKVLVIAHIPPASGDAFPENGEFYLNMTKRFKDTIVGHFFGHTHEDQFELVQDNEGVYGVVMVAPSVTPFGHMNPSYRLYSMDRLTYQLLGYQQFHLNLTKANELAKQGLKPQFELAYTSAQEYGLKDLSPASWAELVERFEQGYSVLDAYHFNVNGKSISADRTCDQLCKVKTVCAVSNIVSTDYLKCVAEVMYGL